MAATKQLRIQNGVVKRLAKEADAYRLEAEQQRARIAGMEAEGRDEHDVRKQKEVLEETEVMIPDTDKRLQVAKAELGTILASSLASDPSLVESEEVKAAQALLAA
ncbi:tubulin-specific chaperone A-like protein [Hyaloraphidium curvatum]|nr:tubulin-specific chaperone A-like protein [Hyaloraphidium curvatum]